MTSINVTQDGLKVSFGKDITDWDIHEIMVSVEKIREDYLKKGENFSIEGKIKGNNLIYSSSGVVLREVLLTKKVM
jgi:tRNA(Ser,Leu) C12 N-acetylase TAN1